MSSFPANQSDRNGDYESKRAKLFSAINSATSASTPATNKPLASVSDPVVSSLSQSAAKKSAGAVHAPTPIHQQQAASTGVVMPTSGNVVAGGSASTKSAPVHNEVSYTDINGKQHTGYVINGTTYTDVAGTTPVAAGSIVTLGSGEKWYKGEDGSYKIEGNPTQVSYKGPDGAHHIGYVINGVTYTDPIGRNPIATGSTVTLPDGTQWYKGAYGSHKVNQQTTTVSGAPYSDLSGLIEQSYDKGDQMIRDTVNHQTQQGVDQLNRALQDAQPNYAAAIANQLLEAKQAQDAKAYRNQINGDRGGIGSAQVDSIGNTGARNREAIAQQQRQLATDTARQIADLRAQGKYEEASQLLQNNQARLSALYNEQVRLQSEEQRRTESLASLGQSYMSAGLMPNQAMLDAMGIDANTAKLYVDLVNGQTTVAGSGSNKSNGNTSNKNYDTNPTYDKKASDEKSSGKDDGKKPGDTSDYQAYITDRMKDALTAIQQSKAGGGNETGEKDNATAIPSPYTTTGGGIAGFNSFMANVIRAIKSNNLDEVNHMLEEYFGRFSKNQWDQLLPVLKSGGIL